MKQKEKSEAKKTPERRGALRKDSGRAPVKKKSSGNGRSFQAIVENAPFGYYRINRAGEWEYVNHVWEEMHSLSREEVIGKSFEITQPPEMLDQARGNVRRAFAGETITGEFSRIMADGSVHYHRFNIQPVKKGGKIVAIEGFVDDITKSRNAERSLQESHDRLKFLMDANPDPHYVADPETYELVFANKSIIKSHGDPGNKKCYEYLQHRDSPCPFCTNDKITGENFGNAFVWEFQNEVTKRFYQCYDQAIKWVDGRIVRYEMAVDITDRKRLEIRRRESEEKYRTLFHRSHDAIATLDPPSWHFMTANHAMIELFGAKNGRELLAYEPWQLSPEHQPDGRPSEEKAREMIAKAVQDGVNFFDWTHKRLSGESFPVTVLLSRVNLGSKTFLQATMRDVTALREAEKEKERLQSQLNFAQRMESVGQLAGGIAHDFNNVLAVILGRVELAMKQIPATEKCHADLDEIRRAAEHAADLTRKLLTFARKQTVAPQVLDLNSSVEEMLKMLHRMIGEDIDLVWKPGKDLWPIRIDPSQVDQILANLCVNARDAIAGVGKLTIETDNKVFDADYCAVHAGYVPGEYVLLAVSDNGCGMDQQTVCHVFEPFFTSKEVGKGTGLGLSTVYGIIKQNDGFINIYSEQKRGDDHQNLHAEEHGR